MQSNSSKICKKKPEKNQSSLGVIQVKKMASEQDKQISIHALLNARKTPTEILKQLGISMSTMYAVSRSEMVDRKEGLGRKAKLDPEEFKTAVQADPLKSMCAHVRDLRVSDRTVRRTVKKVGSKSLVKVERPLLTSLMTETHLLCCKALLNDLKKARANQIIVFSDRKTWMVNPVHNHPNDRNLSFRDANKSVWTLTTMKNPASVMSLGFMASDGRAVPLVWF